ncbi:hypothetical protein A3Q56_08736 [Intoshia linei]|uniref:Transposase IS30-like HTH domain-containing protein n=1 Tax=Intoshia linei TaxID=1819745 RepID=A0A177ANE2_9BILA|nr:hypothetical protein A3Q56_08736 [Intoshia linei]
MGKKDLTKDEKTKITKLLSEGNSHHEIASKIERNVMTIKKYTLNSERKMARKPKGCIKGLTTRGY